MDVIDSLPADLLDGVDPDKACADLAPIIGRIAPSAPEAAAAMDLLGNALNVLYAKPEAYRIGCVREFITDDAFRATVLEMAPRVVGVLRYSDDEADVQRAEIAASGVTYFTMRTVSESAKAIALATIEILVSASEQAAAKETRVTEPIAQKTPPPMDLNELLFPLGGVVVGTALVAFGLSNFGAAAGLVFIAGAYFLHASKAMFSIGLALVAAIIAGFLTTALSVMVVSAFNVPANASLEPLSNSQAYEGHVSALRFALSLVAPSVFAATFFGWAKVAVIKSLVEKHLAPLTAPVAFRLIPATIGEIVAKFS
jgi:hypothetical protein